MRINLALILSIIVAVGIVALVFTAFQISSEKQKLNSDLQAKTVRSAEDFYKAYLRHLEDRDTIPLRAITDSVIKQYSFTGLAIYYNRDSIFPLTSPTELLLQHSSDYITRAVSADTSMGNMVRSEGKKSYEYIRIVKRENKPSLAVIFYADAEYIKNILKSIWLGNFIRWFIQALVISIVTLLVIRWGILRPLNRIVEWVKAARFGNVELIAKRPPINFLAPLYKEISGIAQAMQEARAIAQEEARLRTTGEAIWTPERLNEEMKQILENKMMVVVSNREPYMHVHAGKEIKCIVPASGMVTAMEPILKACGGLWIASGSGDADRETVDKNDKVQVPPYENKYTLRRVWLTKEQEDHYYYGFSNEGLWPLCHIAHTRPVFRKEDWDFYQEVNELYANAVVEEIKNQEDPFILVQDYHFALLPKMIKDRRPDAKVAIFWHIPWPNPESFGICPWQKELLSGMLGADLIGFHTQYHCNNFLETVNNSLESRVIWENFSVKIGNQFTLVKPFPISIAFTLKDYDNGNEQLKLEVPEILKHYGLSAKYLGIGVDRIDYTKGLIEKFLAIERFLEKYPIYQGQFTFVQIGAPSRSLLKTYADTISAVEQEANRINWKFKTRNWQPLLFLKKHHSHEEILPFYRSANLCMVSSLHDGMNLVAKEFIASRNQNDGVLILSQFAGASQELLGAMIINPYDIEQTADAIKSSLEMPKELQHHKMKQMRRVIMGHNVYSWAADILKTMTSIQN
ncbi:MAG TPA: trehalose-6-phosphate synthase [Chitinophagaceae bacterium]|jgi:trehalose 6-phosphate synthase|nr:trehalose-6-phosphate synthase [Chitinophagaceae bacterium]